MSIKRRFRRRAYWLASASLLALAFLILSAAAASAHARLTSSVPAAGAALSQAPQDLQLHFSEKVDAAFSRAKLLAADGTEIPVQALAVDPADPNLAIVRLADPASVAPGVYTLAWRILSVTDGHVTTGTLDFSVGTGQSVTGSSSVETSSRPPWWRVIARWLELFPMLVVTGFCPFLMLVLRRQEQSSRVPRSLVGKWVGLWQATAAFFLAGLILSLLDQGLLATGVSERHPPSFHVYWQIATDSRFGAAWLVRAASLATLAAIVAIVARKGEVSRIVGVAGIAVGAVMLVTLPYSGHAAAESNRTLAMANDWIHLLAGSIWFGGLSYLLIALVALRGADSRDVGASTADLVSRFSHLAIAMVGLLALSGAVNAAFHIAGPRALRDQDYGVVLIIKIVLIAALLIAAGVNLFVNRPKLALLAGGGNLDLLNRQITTTWITVAIELALGAAIVFASSALTELPPADAPLTVDVAAKSIVIDQKAGAGDLSVWLLARLDSAADDRYTVSASDLNGIAPTNLQRVIVEATITQSGGSPLTDRFDALPMPGNAGAYAFPAVRLGLEGSWHLNVVIRRAGMEDVSAPFIVDTTGTAPPLPRAVADAWRWPRVPIASWGLAVLAVATGIGGLIGVSKLRGLEPIAAALLLTMVALIAAGFAVSAARQTIPQTDDTDRLNPVVADSSSVQRASPIYAANCLACHGAAGQGVTTVDPEHAHGSGANLIDSRSEKMTEGDLFSALTNGVPGSAMPAFDVAMTEEQRWDLVNYIRMLQKSVRNKEATPAS